MLSIEKKILFITTISGFMQKFMMNDVKLLQDKGWQVHYASNFDNPIYECSVEELEANGIICHNIVIQKSPLKLSKNLKALRSVIEIIERERIQAIHCNNPVGGVVGRLAGAFSKTHPYVIYTAHGFHFYKGAKRLNWILFYPVEKYMARFTDQIVTINHEDKLRAEKFTLHKNGLVSQIPGVGYSAKRFHVDDAKRQRKRQQLGIQEDELFFLSVGELNQNKNHEIVIRALSHVKDDTIKYGICGEGPEHERLQEVISNLGMENRVFLFGYQTKVEEYMNAADCFIFPSIREGLGMAAIEAMACGLPLIVADNRGTREYARENAVICQAEDKRAFAKAMYAISKHPKKRRQMAAASIEIAKQFTDDKAAQIMSEVYDIMEQAIG